MSSERKLDILITTAWYPTDTSTSGVFVKEQGEALCRAGHRVTVLLITYSTLSGWLRNEKPKFDSSELLEVVHLHVVFPLPGRMFNDPAAYFKRTILAKADRWMKGRVAENRKPDIIHHHCLSDNAYVAESISQRYSIPYIFTEHSNYFKYDELSKFNRFESFEDHKRFVQGAAQRIAVSNVRAKGYAAIFDAPFVAISNMVQEMFAVPIRQEERPKPFTFACVAILERRKRQDILIRAFASAFKGTATKLLIVGNGKLEQEYRKLSVELGVQSQVEFTGKVNRAGIFQIFDRVHAAVLSSDEETFGVVLAEAMFRGIPVVSTICGGPEEIVTPETGVLCGKGDWKALAEAMSALHTNYSGYDKQVIRKYAADHFSEEVIIRQLESVYWHVLQEQN